MPRRVAAVFLHYGVDDVYLLQVMEGFFFHLFFFYFFFFMGYKSNDIGKREGR